MKGTPTKTGRQRRGGVNVDSPASTRMQRPATSERTKHPDDFEPGLRFAGKTLNTNEVKRAKTPLDVIPVCLAHNLRDGNEHHRHRVESIDPARTHLNEVLRGQSILDAAVSAVDAMLIGMGITPKRQDTIVGIELVIQPPPGWDRPEFWTECLSWVDSRYEYLVHAVVHRDQHAAHAHIIALAVRGGRFAGDAMTRGRNMFKAQRIDFFDHMRDTLGIRPDRKVKTLEELAVSPGRGPKTRAAAERRDRKLLKLHSAGMGVGGHGGSDSVEANPHAQAQQPTPLLRSPWLPRSTAAGATKAHSPAITRPCPPPLALRPAAAPPPSPQPPTVATAAAPDVVRHMPHRFVIPPGLFARGQAPPPAATNSTPHAMQPASKEAA